MLNWSERFMIAFGVKFCLGSEGRFYGLKEKRILGDFLRDSVSNCDGNEE